MSDPTHLRIAITTNDLLQVDADFLDARQFVFYGLTPEKALFLDCVQFKDRPRTAGSGAGGGEKKGGGRCCAAGAPQPAIGNSIDARIEALAGSSVLFTLAMSDPEAVRVADLGVFPIKLGGARSIYEVLDRLQEMMKGTPPLWLRRVSGHASRSSCSDGDGNTGQPGQRRAVPCGPAAGGQPPRCHCPARPAGGAARCQPRRSGGYDHRRGRPLGRGQEHPAQRPERPAQPGEWTITVAGIGRLDDAAALRGHRLRTATIFQEHALIDRLSALDNVLLGLADRRNPLSPLPWPKELRRCAADALADVGLLHRACERAGRLSGGERQRVGVAGALVRQPSLMLADEPFASLDPVLVRTLSGALREAVSSRSVTLVIVLHHIEMARALAGRIIGLVDGRVAFAGPPQEFDAKAEARLFQST